MLGGVEGVGNVLVDSQGRRCGGSVLSVDAS